MLGFRKTSLRFRLFLLVVLSMLPVSGLMFYHALEERDRKLREIQEEAVRYTELSASSISNLLEGSRQILSTLAHTARVRAMNGSGASSLFEDLVKNFKPYLNIGLVRADGLVIGSALPLNGEVYLSDRPWFIRLQKTRSFAMSEYQIGRITGKPSINIGYPLPSKPDAPSAGVVFAALDQQALQECIAKIQLPFDGVILVVDRNGTYVARNPNPGKWLGSKSNSWAALQAKGGSMEGFLEATGVDKIARIYHYTPVPNCDNGLFVAVGISKNAIMAETWAGFRHNMLWLGIWTMGSLMAAWLFGHYSVIRHVRQLAHASRRLASGDWNASARLSGGTIELRQFSQAFDEMAKTLRQHNDHLEWQVAIRTSELSAVNRALHEEISERKNMEKALRDYQEHLSEAQKIANMGSWKRDLKTGELTWSTETCRIFGWPENKPINFERFLQFVHPEDVEALLSQLDDSRKMQKDMESEHRIIRMDGQIRHIHERGQFKRDEQGCITHLEGISQDITERKLIEAEREKIITALQEALSQVKTLSGLLPICSGCKKIRDDKGYWSQIESYVAAHSEAQFSHGLCPDCAKQFFPNYEQEIKKLFDSKEE